MLYISAKGINDLNIWYDMTLMYVHLYYHFKALNEKHKNVIFLNSWM